MRLSVIIPTRGGAAATRFLAAVSRQLQPADELIVSIDGGEPPTDADRHGAATFISREAAGPAAARNRAIDRATGDVILFLNDDAEAQTDLLDAHRCAHADAALGPQIIVGAAPWATPADDRVLDRLLRETSMVFFHDQMTADDPAKDWGFRHAWTLNLSVPRVSVGRFDERLRHPMFDDLLWAHGLGLPVRYRPEARVLHHHRYTARAALRREALLGHQAYALHRIDPACAQAMFADRYAQPSPVDANAISEAAGSFAAFDATADQPGSTLDAAEVRRLFDLSRSWREAARMLGVGVAETGRPAEQAMDTAERVIAGDAVVVADAAGAAR